MSYGCLCSRVHIPAMNAFCDRDLRPPVKTCPHIDRIAGELCFGDAAGSKE
jgi:hypothetical protein